MHHQFTLTTMVLDLLRWGTSISLQSALVLPSPATSPIPHILCLVPPRPLDSPMPCIQKSSQSLFSLHILLISTLLMTWGLGAQPYASSKACFLIYLSYRWGSPSRPVTHKAPTSPTLCSGGLTSTQTPRWKGWWEVEQKRLRHSGALKIPYSSLSCSQQDSEPKEQGQRTVGKAASAMTACSKEKQRSPRQK